jgi:hypothetical protein
MNSIMTFSQNDLLTFNEIDLLIKSEFPNEKSNLLATKLINKCFILKKSFYVLQNNITYKIFDNEQINKNILKISTLLIEESFKNLNENDKRLTKAENSDKKHNYKVIFTNSFIEKFYAQLYIDITKDDSLEFDVTLNELHYNNGYLDLTDLQFKQRDTTKHFITKFISRDYKQSSETDRKNILNIVKKVYPNSKDFECILSVFGSALSGTSNIDQETLFLMGKGSSGKSFTLKLTQEAIEPYFKILQADIFSQSNSKIDKILNTFANSPEIRIIWINEMKDTKMDDSLFKSFCEGELQTTQLYKDGTCNIKHYGKCIATSNGLPNIKIDTGVKRRFIGYEHKSKFLKESDIQQGEKIDEKNNIYLEDRNILTTIKTSNLLDAWVDILALYCHKWLKGEKPKWTKNFEETKDTVMNSNDWIQDFIDENLTITNNVEDRIGKNEMHNSLKASYPDRHLSVQQVISSLKAKSINYMAQWRVKTTNIQGCFSGVKLKNNNKYDPFVGVNDVQLDKGIIKEQKPDEKDILIKDLQIQIEKLKQQLLSSNKVSKSKVSNKTKQNKCEIDFDIDEIYSLI